MCGYVVTLALVIGVVGTAVFSCVSWLFFFYENYVGGYGFVTVTIVWFVIHVGLAAWLSTRESGPSECWAQLVPRFRSGHVLFRTPGRAARRRRVGHVQVEPPTSTCVPEPQDEVITVRL